MRSAPSFAIKTTVWCLEHNRHLIGIIIALLTFVAGSYSTRLHPKPISRFKLVSQKEGEHFGKFHSREYETWDGKRLHLYCYTDDSEQEARAWFYEDLSDATEILERSPFLNERGEQVGERVVAVFPTTSRRGRIWAVVVLKGVNVFMMFGESLSQVLEFEKFPEIRHHNLTSR